MQLSNKTAMKIVVIGAGIGGLTTAALLAKAGLDVTVLEAHVYPGGCAGTFYHQGYRFDAGATLAGGFSTGGPMDIIAKQVGISAWPAHESQPAMVVHLPDGCSVTRWGDERRWAERRLAFGDAAQSFWQWQEHTADAPPWPPQTFYETTQLVQKGTRWIGDDWRKRLSPQLFTDMLQPAWHRLPDATSDKQAQRLRLFVDAQLLIAAQTTSLHANALYAASALDLPRRGIVHLEGGIGGIAKTIAQAVTKHGGRVHYRQEVARIVCDKQSDGSMRPVAVETKKGDSVPTDAIVANLTPWNIANLLGDAMPSNLRELPPKPTDGWGAFMVYVGIEESIIPPDFPLHHQVIANEPLGEGNTVFLSLSPAWDRNRAPAGKRALTISTHTDLSIWWRLHRQDIQLYEERKNLYVEKMLNLANRVLSSLPGNIDLILPGTPVTFQRFTKREWGWVGGFPQTNLFRAWAPKLSPNLWMVGDSIFPGQSTAAVALGGLRVADAVLKAAI